MKILDELAPKAWADSADGDPNTRKVRAIRLLREALHAEPDQGKSIPLRQYSLAIQRAAEEGALAATPKPFDRERLASHAGWRLHQASGCDCDMDSAPTIEVERARVVIDAVEADIRADERHHIIAEIRRYALLLGVVDSAGRYALEQYATKLEETTAS